MSGKLIAGNWKMNGEGAALQAVQAMLAALSAINHIAVDIVICPPATLLERAARMIDDDRADGLIKLGGQDCHAAHAGAYTGDISAAMLKDAGASFVIVGHSERRLGHGETSALVLAKAQAAITQGLIPIICLGERLDEREAGQTLAVVLEQLASSVPSNADPENFVIAYEPVWAIGTGRTPTLEQIIEVHQALRQALLARFGAAGKAVRLLYGGSVKPDNAATILHLPNVDGALVGGASLQAADFIPIISSATA